MAQTTTTTTWDFVTRICFLGVANMGVANSCHNSDHRQLYKTSLASFLEKNDLLQKQIKDQKCQFDEQKKGSFEA